MCFQPSFWSRNVWTAESVERVGWAQTCWRKRYNRNQYRAVIDEWFYTSSKTRRRSTTSTLVRSWCDLDHVWEIFCKESLFLWSNRKRFLPFSPGELERWPMSISRQGNSVKFQNLNIDERHRSIHHLYLTSIWKGNLRSAMQKITSCTYRHSIK